MCLKEKVAEAIGPLRHVRDSETHLVPWCLEKVASSSPVSTPRRRRLDTPLLSFPFWLWTNWPPRIVLDLCFGLLVMGLLHGFITTLMQPSVLSRNDL